jgi:hypothetical protein
VVGGTAVGTAGGGASVAGGGAAVVAGAHAPKIMLLKTNREINCSVILFIFCSFLSWRSLLGIWILT